MKINKYQTGAATLLTAIMITIGVTLITFLTGKSILVEQKISADEYRTIQATAAANAAMDFGVAYFDDGGFDHDDDGNLDLIAEMTFNSTDNSQSTFGQIVFNNSTGPIVVNGQQITFSCVDVDGTMKAGMLIATGFSDDRDSQRVITQCVGTIPLLGESGPEQPLISRGAVGMTGSSTVINRYSNMTIWAGNSIDIGNSAAMSTYLRTQGTDVSDFTDAELMDATSNNPPNAQKISSKRLGNGFDVVDNDPNLSNLTGDDFFINFFSGTKAEMESLAENISQHFVSDDSNISATLEGLEGIIWVEGNARLTSQVQIGSLTDPVIVIINGNLTFNGPTIFGLLYVIGQLDVAGNATVIGSSIVEGDPVMVPAGQAPVVGSGNLTLVYAPSTLGDGNGNPPKGTTTLIAGSWRDW